jgi:hypothetical protein
MKKLTKKQKAAFASRFSLDDWGWLCTQSRFLEAFEAGDLEVAEVIAHELLSSR